MSLLENGDKNLLFRFVHRCRTSGFTLFLLQSYLLLLHVIRPDGALRSVNLFSFSLIAQIKSCLEGALVSYSIISRVFLKIPQLGTGKIFSRCCVRVSFGVRLYFKYISGHMTYTNNFSKLPFFGMGLLWEFNEMKYMSWLLENLK